MKLEFPKLEPESGHLLHLDALRLIASTGIIVLHLSNFVDTGSPTNQLVALLLPLNLFVDMFFVVSGFVIAFTYFDRVRGTNEYLSFLRNRVARLAPLHWATLAIFLAGGILADALSMKYHHKELFDTHCLLLNFLFLHATGMCPHISFNAPSWSVSAEMGMYMAVPPLFWLMKRSIVAFGLATTLVWLGLALGTRGSHPWLSWTYDGGIFRAVPSFMFGAFLFGARRLIATIPFARSGYWLSLFAFLAFCGTGISIIALLLILYAAVTFGVAADAQSRSSRIVRSMAAAGQLTYSSYMLHQLIIVTILSLFADHLLRLHGFEMNLLVLVVLIAVWPVAYFSFFLFERPTRAWIRKLWSPVAYSKIG